MKDIKNGRIEPVTLKTEWQKWLDGGLFKNKYYNYLAIICTYSPKSKYGSLFCDYVSTRIRLQLLFSIEILQDIEYCHLNPKKFLNNQKCPKQFKSVENDWFCNIWLIGIMFKQNKEQKQLETLEGENNLIEFSKRIKFGKNVLETEWIHKQQRIDSINSVLLRIEEGQKVGSFNECLERCCNITKCSAITFTGFLTKTSDLNSTNPSKCLLFSCINKSSFNIDGRCQFNKGTNEEINIGLLSVEILRETLNNESNLNEGNKINEKDLQLNGEIDYKIKQIRYEERNHSVLNLSTWDEMFPLDPQHIPVWIIGLAIVAVFTVIENLTKDGRDRSLDYKISNIFVAKGSHHSQVIKEFERREDEMVIPKTSSSLFNSTNFEYLMRNIGIDTIIVTGFLTDQCVAATICDGADRGFWMICVNDACGTSTRERHVNALNAFKGYCRMESTETIINAIQKDIKK
uniref:Isochorismatase domain-containing protein n=1 Tax=Meloidogyne hapla TaxID=6305 RepID=A0A1I8BD37_MELHA